jgi:hypothetical protein
MIGLFLFLFLTVATAQARDAKQVYAFRKVNACPATGLNFGPCPGWVVDHVCPLCWGCLDNPFNMQWQEKQVSYIKDVFEREACALKKKHK